MNDKIRFKTLIDLGKLTVVKKTGSERFQAGEHKLDFALLDFWRWSASDLVSNATRGILWYVLKNTLIIYFDSINWRDYLPAKNYIKIEFKEYEIDSIEGGMIIIGIDKKLK